MIKLRVIIVIFIIVSIVCFGFYLFRESRVSKIKVMLIGLDGADWDVILPLVNQGKMPNFERLIKQGSWGYLKTIKPTRSPILWTSIATGKSPDKHGISDFVVNLPGSYKTVPITSNLRKVKALWNILSEHRKKVNIVSWLATWPAEKINGFMISDRFSPRPVNKAMVGLTYPERLFNEIKNLRINWNEVTAELLESLNFPTENSCVEGWNFCIATPLQNSIASYSLDQTSVNVGSHLLNKYNWDLFAIYLLDIDWVSHKYWKYMEPQYFQVPEEEIEKYKDVIKNYYIYTDGIVGDFLRFAGKDTVVIIVSDHGFEANVSSDIKSYYQAFPLNKLMEALGLLRYKHDMSYFDRREFNREDFIDWKKTEAYELAATTLGWGKKIALNLKGREPEGIIEPGEYARTRTRIKQLLSKIVIKGTNKPFLRVEPCSDNGCDFIVSFNVDKEDIDKRHILYLNQVDSLPIRQLFLYNHVSGYHDNAPEGILLLWGKNIQRRKIKDASIFDITPTILYLLDLPVARDMDGKVISSAISTEFIRSNPVRYIDTYEDEKGREGKPLSSPVDEEIKERLRSLGYLQ